LGSITVDVGIAIEVTRAWTPVVDDRIGILRGRGFVRDLESLQNEHDDRFIVARRRESMTRRRRDRRPVGALDAGDFTRSVPLSSSTTMTRSGDR